jgi:Arc/MetJ family transcription regulator
VRLVFGSHDHEEYSAARERLQSLVVAWARHRGVPVDPALVAAALDHRHGVDGRLGHWTRAHVADALAVWFPRTVALLDDDRDAVPAALHALVGFLAERDWLDGASATPAQLHAQIDDSTPALHDALTDERNLDLGTFWAVQLRRHGIPAADPAAVARFLEQVRRGETDVDREALAEVTQRGAGQVDTESATSADLPPVLLPGAATLLAAADASEALGRLRTVTRWVRTGRPLTADGRLLLTEARALAVVLGVDAFSRDHARTADDLPETSLLVAWARQSRLVRVVKGRLVPVKGAAPLLGKPIELWHRAFTALSDLGEHFGGSNVFGAPSLFGMSLGEALPILLFELYAAGGDPIPLELFHRLVREAVNERFGCVVDDLAGDVEQRLWRRDVTALVDALELLGAVTLSESHEHDELTALAGRDDPDPTLVALTPIGLWAVRELLLEQGVPAPLVGELAQEDVEYVCVRLAGVRPEVAEAELAAWVAARSPRAAADELARLLRRTDDPAHRVLALSALRRNGERRDGELRTRDRGGREAGRGLPSRGPRTGPLPIRARSVHAGKSGSAKSG